MPTQKRTLWFPDCFSSNAHAQYPIRPVFLPEASSISLLRLRTAKALARLGLCGGLLEPLLIAYMINTLFSCAGSFTVDFLTFEHLYDQGNLCSSLRDNHSARSEGKLGII